MSARAPRTAVAVLYQGNDYERITVAAARVQTAEDEEIASNGRTGDEDRVAVAREEYEAVLAEVLETATEVRVKSIGVKWRPAKREHPPRPEDEADEAMECNRDTWPRAAIDICLVEPTFSTAEERTEWLNDLTDGEVDLIYAAASGLNEGAPAAPKALALRARTEPTGK